MKTNACANRKGRSATTRNTRHGSSEKHDAEPFDRSRGDSHGSTKREKHRNPPDAIKRLQMVNWDFTDANTSYLTHSLHPYPAKFIPQIPNALIRELSEPGDTVGDIFCGSGTTLLEALLLGRNAVGLDANPLACLISESKITPLGDGDQARLAEVCQRALEFANRIKPSDDPLRRASHFSSAAPKPSYPNLHFWFEPFIIEELAEILQWCRDLPNLVCRNIALTSFSAIVVNVSNQDSDTRYVRRAKNLRPGGAFRRFAQKLAENSNAVEQLSTILKSNVKGKVVHADGLNPPAIPKLDLVVCSPPYPNAYSYHLYHGNRMLWLGMDKIEFKSCEIGSHRKYSSTGKNGANIETFRGEMCKIFTWLRTSLRVSGYACFVIGNSVIRGKSHDNAEILKKVAAEMDFDEVASFPRNMKDTQKAFNPRIGRIKTEAILIFRNTDGIGGEGRNRSS